MRSSVSKAVARDGRQLERRGELDVPCTGASSGAFMEERVTVPLPIHANEGHGLAPSTT